MQPLPTIQYTLHPSLSLVIPPKFPHQATILQWNLSVQPPLSHTTGAVQFWSTRCAVFRVFHHAIQFSSTGNPQENDSFCFVSVPGEPINYRKCTYVSYFRFPCHSRAILTKFQWFATFPCHSRAIWTKFQWLHCFRVTFQARFGRIGLFWTLLAHSKAFPSHFRQSHL